MGVASRLSEAEAGSVEGSSFLHFRKWMDPVARSRFKIIPVFKVI